MNCRGLLESFLTQGKIIEECQRRDARWTVLGITQKLAVHPIKKAVLNLTNCGKKVIINEYYSVIMKFICSISISLYLHASYCTMNVVVIVFFFQLSFFAYHLLISWAIQF